jgi:hypothetical protein
MPSDGTAPTVDAVPLPANKPAKIKFVNELGNTIHLATKTTKDGGVELEMQGPTTHTTWEITRMEAHKLLWALAVHLNEV